VRTKTPNLVDRMLDTAARLFGAHRFHEVRMEDVAAEAEVSKGTLYRYFKDKEEMYLALLERASRNLVTLLERRLAQAEGAKARLIILADALIGYFDDQPHLLDLIQRAEVMRDTGAGFPWQQARDATIRMVKGTFVEGERLGEFHVHDPEQAALMLLGGLRAIVRFGAQPRPDDLAERIVDDFLNGAARPGPSCRGLTPPAESA
jgi:AcrR family transcriptional regulator